MRNPATDAVTTGDQGPVWSVAVAGEWRGDQVRVELVGDRARIYATTTAGSRAVELAVDLPVAELRALVKVISQWPGVVE